MKYYKTDSRKISFREYYNIARGGGWMMAWFFKFLGIPMNLTSGIPVPQSFRESIINPNAVPPATLAKLNSVVLDLKKLGFGEAWFHGLNNSLIGGLAYGVTALHSSQHTIAKVIFVSMKQKETLVVGLISELSDGKIFATTNNRPQFNQPFEHIVIRRIGASASTLWELHQSKLAEFNATNPPRSVNGFEDLVALDDKNTKSSFDDKIKRGIWVEMADAEVDELRKKLTLKS